MLTLEEFVNDIKGLKENTKDYIFIRNFFEYEEVNYINDDFDCLINFYHHLIRKKIKVFYFKLGDDNGLIENFYQVWRKLPNEDKEYSKSWQIADNDTDASDARVRLRSVMDSIHRNGWKPDVVFMTGGTGRNILDMDDFILNNIDHQYVVRIFEK